MMQREEYDRVTQVLSPFSGMDKIDPIVLSNAATRGSLVHSLCQGWIERIDIEPTEHVKGYLDSFVQWAEDKSFLPTPPRLYCDEKQLTGEVDGLMHRDGKIFLFDLKTSQNESCTWKYQSAAYAYLLEKNDIKIDGEVFVRLSKDGKKAKEHFYNHKDNLNMFLNCLETYRVFYKNKKHFNLEDL